MWMPGADTYWRIEPDTNTSKLKEEARAAGYYIKTSANREDTHASYKRFLRGCVSYDNCDVEELRKFHLDRGLGKGDRLGHQKLVKILEAADDNIVFSKILDLPAELRCRIYDFYVAALPQVLRSPSQPPLARTCKIIRNEVLPVFYSSINFEIELSGRRRDDQDHIALAASSYQFLASLQPQQTAQISSLAIVRSSTKLAIKLDKGRKVWDVTSGRWSYVGGHRIVSGNANVETDVRLVLGEDHGQARPLTIERLYAIRRCAEPFFA